MFPVVISNSSSALDSSSVNSPSRSRDPDLPRDSVNSFLKDGRKINLGDCALFKPPKDTPPFIGIIRRLTTAEEGNLTLGVNWLYRPSDVKLAKGVLLEAAPNELFYSFHEDEIPAVSLLHPCKVAFLNKGAELPSGALSFVCRRVYDTETKCLWWLTDKDYVKERQEEVDTLLKKTTLEMHGGVQSGGRSPKPLSCPASTSQLKSGSEGVQNSNALSSQAKSKKRERGDQVCEQSKRERLQKPENGDSGEARTDQMLKSEIAKVTDKGGLVEYEGVEKLVQLMQRENSERKMDVAGRVLLADVISATDRFDCLGWFVQLKGLSILDEWLQEVHKKKIGDSCNAKESEKIVEDFLLALLRALDKLPVDLHALQTCNVGKSVNHLRTHKNSEISKKAKILVDTWKKRVEAEMNMNDMKVAQTRSVGWPSKPAASENSQVENRKTGASADSGVRNSAAQSSAKASQIKNSAGEAHGKEKGAVSSSSSKPTAPNNANQRASAGAVSSELNPIKDDRSSNSSPSQNNSQSCSGDQGKMIGNSCKEDAKSSTTGSASKSSGSASRHRKSSNGVHTPPVSAAPKENSCAKTIALNHNLLPEKSSPTSGQERSTDIDYGNNQRLIVKLPSSSGPSPSRVANPSTCEDSSATSGKTSVVKHEISERRLRTRNDSLRADAMMCKCPDGIVSAEEGNGAIPLPDETQKASEEVNPAQISNASGSSTAARSGKIYDVSLSSMNALVESCVKFSEANASTSPDDDGAMNLLASVAAEEMVRSDNVSTSASPQRTALTENTCSVNEENKANDVGSEEVKDEKVEPDLQCDVPPLPSSKPEDLPGDSVVMSPPLKNESQIDAKDAGNSSSSGRSGSSCNPNSNAQEDKAEAKPEDCTAENAVPENITCGEKASNCAASEIDVPEASVSVGPGVIVDYSLTSQVEFDGKMSGEADVKVDVEEEHGNTDSTGEDVVASCADEKASKEETLSTLPAEKTDVACELHASDEPSSSTAMVKLDFDLNEGFPSDEGNAVDPPKIGSFGASTALHLPSPLPPPSGNSITIAAAAKGSFVPPENPLRCRGEPGWKGSAATSAFRPAEPRKGVDSAAETGKPNRRLLDFDLNVADEPLTEDSAPTRDRGSSSGGLDLDLNRAEENPELAPFAAKASSKMELLSMMNRSSRDFDLNNGPGLDDDVASRIQTFKGSLPFPPSRMNGTEVNFSSWFPPANSFSCLSVPQIRSDHNYIGSQRILAPPNATTSYGLDVYRGPVLTSSPAVYPYSGFPFDTGYTPSTSTFSGGSLYGDSSAGGALCFPTVPSPLVGPSGIETTPYPRPFLMSIPGTEMRKWGGPIDLNSGPGVDDRLPASGRQVSVGGAQEEQLKGYQVATGGAFKRKEPDGGWDSSDRFSYRQASWQ